MTDAERYSIAVECLNGLPLDIGQFSRTEKKISAALKELEATLRKEIDMWKQIKRRYSERLGILHKQSLDERMKEADNMLVAIAMKQKSRIVELEEEIKRLGGETD